MEEEKKSTENVPPVTVSETLLVSFGALTSGFAIGVLYQFRKQNRKFDFRRYDFRLATKALAAGTALCLGTFSILGTIFVYTTGVTTFKGLRYYLESIAKGKQITGPSKDEIEYNEATKGMTLSQEWDYLYSKYVVPEEKSNEFESLFPEQLSNEELLEWENKSNESEKSD